MMDDDEALKESVSNLRSAILLRRTDIVRGILSTAAEYRGEDEMFGDDEDGELDSKVPYDYYDDPFDILRMMLNYVDNDAGTCLHLATKLEYADAVRALLAAGADPTIVNKEGATSYDYCAEKSIQSIYNEELLQAAASSNVERMRRLLAAGVSANASDGASSDNKVLHWAASYGSPETVKLLCENEADVNLTNSQGMTALHDAVKRGDMDIVLVLLQYGASRSIMAHSGPLKDCKPVDLADSQEMRHLLESYEFQIPVSNSQMVQDKDSNSDSESSSSETPSLSSQGPPLQQYPSLQSQLKQVSTSAQSSSCPIPVDPCLLRLWPSPQKLTQLKGPRFFPTTSLHIFVCRGSGTGDSSAACEVWNTLEPHFQQVGYSIDIQISSTETVSKSAVAGSVECYINSSLFTRPESYKMHISALKVSIVSSELSSMWHAANTLLQILRLFHGKGVPQVQICDWPSLKHRGLLLDVSTGRVPKLETLFSLVDTLSSIKMNQLQLYMQNSFAFRGHDAVWRNSSAYTPSELVKLDSYCRARYVELVPHFESLTGFSGWFKFRQYKDLADLPVDLEKVENKIPSGLCPTNDESIRLVSGLFTQLFPCFASQRFAHVGLDINEEFGTGKSQPVANSHGCGEVFMSYQRSVYKLCCQSGRSLQFWANPLHRYPEQLWNLPPDVVAVEYGEQIDHEFEKYCSRLSEAGVNFLVSPGTLNWNSVCGNYGESLKVINNAVQAAASFGALGVLIADWSVPSHLNPLVFSIPVILAGAGLAWKPDSNLDFVQSILPDVVSMHVFLDKSMKIGKVLQNLGNANSVLAKPGYQGKTFAAGVSVHPQEHALRGTTLWEVLAGVGPIDVDSFSLDTVQKANLHIRKCQKLFSELNLHCSQNSSILKELDITVDLLLFACRICRALLLARKQAPKATSVKDLPAINRTDLANRMLGILEHFQKVYSLRNKQGGLLTSVQSLKTILQDLLPEGRLDDPIS